MDEGVSGYNSPSIAISRAGLWYLWDSSYGANTMLTAQNLDGMYGQNIPDIGLLGLMLLEARLAYSLQLVRAKVKELTHE